MVGPRARHGPHQGAQKSMRVGESALIRASKFSAVTSTDECPDWVEVLLMVLSFQIGMVQREEHLDWVFYSNSEVRSWICYRKLFAGSFEEDFGDGECIVGGEAVLGLAGNAGRARGEECEFTGEFLVFVELGVGAELEEDFGESFVVFECGFGWFGVVVWELSDGGLEHAAAELRVLVPLAEGSEDGEDLVVGVAPGFVGESLDAFHHDHGALVEDLDDEEVFGTEVVVQGHFGDACFFEDAIDSSCVEPFAFKEFSCAGEYEFAF